MTLYPTHFHPLDVNVDTIEFEGLDDDFLEITDWPAFILWAKVTVRYRDVQHHETGQDSVFVSVLSAPTKPILKFEVDQQLITLNTTDTNQSDEFLGQSVLGFHPFAEFGIQVYRRMRLPTPKDEIDSRVCVTVAWVAKNDYAGAYGNPDWWKGSRWDAACGRGGSPFLSGYGAYPDASGDDDGGDADPGDDTDLPVPEAAPEPADPPADAPSTDGNPGSDDNFGVITNEAKDSLVNSAFLRISTYPVKDDGDF